MAFPKRSVPTIFEFNKRQLIPRLREMQRRRLLAGYALVRCGALL